MLTNRRCRHAEREPMASSTASESGTGRRRCAASVPTEGDLIAWTMILMLLPVKDILRCRAVCHLFRRLTSDLVKWMMILMHLPAKEIIRCRAVCRLFRHLTSDKDFLLAHHRWQPSLPLVYFHGQVDTDSDRNRGKGTDAGNDNNSGKGTDMSSDSDSDAIFDAFLDTFDIRQSPAVRRRVLGFNDYSRGKHDFKIRDSCDGLLLIEESNHRFYICNPVTREWASLPEIRGKDRDVIALYPHHKTGDYHILYWRLGHKSTREFLVITVGSSEKPRMIGVHVVPNPTTKREGVVCNGLCNASLKAPVLLEGRLYWSASTSTDTNIHKNLIVFDTVSETFDLMESPAPVVYADLFEMDGKLGICCLDHKYEIKEAMIWVMQDYKSKSWSLKFHIKLPTAEMIDAVERKYFYATIVSENGDMLVSPHCSKKPWYLFHVDCNGKLLEKYQWDGIAPRTSSCRFKESLVKHSFLKERYLYHETEPPRFFRKL